MKIFHSLKLASLLVLAVSLTVGCASTTEEVGQDTAAAAIAAAKTANDQVKAEEYEWRDTGKLIKKAKKAMAEGRYAEAVKLANKARRQAENAIKQKNIEMKRLAAAAAAAKAATASESSAKAAVVTASTQQYTVTRGDNLWDISAKPSIYNNPYQWPLIYKNNSDQIKDADLIYPGQKLDINTNPSSADVDAAVAHAKSRGSWSLGVVEDSDTAYLAR
ncbi:hypothetical protein MNBD_GAMMA24-819 [hydrothermal vent metagenome]|uniref:LysM domain-containing protein n=1 Tax=hydrothermal vent metagenome TaxID=652676 RepID=A0A3B1BQH9_9ZZZZ